MADYKIAVLASGSGTTAEAFVLAVLAKKLKMRLALVISNNKEAGVFERVRKLNKQHDLSIKTLHISSATHPEPGFKKYEQTDAESRAIVAALQQEDVDLVILMGYMKKVGGQLLEKYGALPGQKSIYEARMLNTHPGPLPQTRGFFGIHVQEEVLKTGLGYSAHTVHLVAEEYDVGAVIAEHKVPVIEGDTAKSLFERVQLTEKTCLPLDAYKFLNHQI